MSASERQYTICTKARPLLTATCRNGCSGEYTCVPRALMPVSYTHLDVYKRQQCVLAEQQHGRKLAGKADLVQCFLVFPHALPVVGNEAGIVGILCRQNAEQRGFARAVASDRCV